MPELSTIYDYMRSHAAILGQRILQEYPALHQFDDLVSARLTALLREPFPAQAIAIMGLAKRWQQARTGMVVAECGTGKTLISLGAIHVHSAGNPFTALAMTRMQTSATRRIRTFTPCALSALPPFRKSSMRNS